MEPGSTEVSPWNGPHPAIATLARPRAPAPLEAEPGDAWRVRARTSLAPESPADPECVEYEDERASHGGQPGNERGNTWRFPSGNHETGMRIGRDHVTRRAIRRGRDGSPPAIFRATAWSP